MVNTNSQVMASITSKASAIETIYNHYLDNAGEYTVYKAVKSDSFNFDGFSIQVFMFTKKRPHKGMYKMTGEAEVRVFKDGNVIASGFFESATDIMAFLKGVIVVEESAPVINEETADSAVSETPETKTIKAITRISKTYSCGLGTEIHLQIKNKETGHYCTMRFKLPTVKRDVATALVKEWIIKADEFLTVEVSADGKFDCTAFVDAVRYLQYQYAMANGLPVKWNKVPTDPWAKAVETDSAVSEAPETDSAVSETPETKIELSDEIYEQVAKNIADDYIYDSDYGMRTFWVDGDAEYMDRCVAEAMGTDVDYVEEHINIDYDRLWNMAYTIWDEAISEAPETDSNDTPGKIDLSDEIYEQVAKSMADIYSEFGYLCDDNDYMAFEVSCALDVDIDYVWEHINIDYKRLWHLAVRAGAEKIISDSILAEAEPVIKYIDEHLSDDHYFTDAVAVDKDAQGDDFDLERAIGNYLFYAIVDKDGEPRFDDSIIYKAVEQYNWTMDEDGDIYWTKKEPDSGFNKKIKVFEDGKIVVKSGNEYLLLGRDRHIIDSIVESEFSNDLMNNVWAFMEDPCNKKEPDSGACKGSVVVESNKGDKVA